MARITLTDKGAGYPNLASDFNTLKAGINDLYPVAEAHNTVLLFDKNTYMDAPVSQSGPLTYTLATSGHVDGAVKRLRILSDGVNPISFPETFTCYGLTTDGTTSGILPSGLYSIWLVYLGGTVEVNIPAGVGSASGGGTGTGVPTVSLGSDMSVTLPSNSVTINSAVSDPGGSITAYQWTQQAGPNTATLAGATTATLTASGLVQGSYTFRLTVTDNEANTAYDEIIVVVNPAQGGFDFYDSFSDGVMLDANWQLVNLNPTEVSFAETGGKLVVTCNGVGAVDTFNNELESTRIITSGVVQVTVDLSTNATGSKGFGLLKDKNSFILIQNGMSKGPRLRLRATEANVSKYDAAHPTYATTQGTPVQIKIKYMAGAVTVSAWDGAQWVVLFGPVTIAIDQLKFVAFGGGTASVVETLKLDDFYIASSDYTTQYPS